MADKGIDLSKGAPTGEKKGGANYILAIAIDEYKHCPRLYNCVQDAQRLLTVLSARYQFENRHTFTLFNEQATEHAIIDQFKKLVRLIQPEDNLLILFSGHGEYEKEIDEGYWIPVDAPQGHTNEYIANSRIIKYIRAIPSHHTFLIIDSCFSGSLFANRSLNQPTGNHRLDNIASRWLLTAGRNEVVSDGKPGDHSPFADNVIYFLENNQEPSLSVTTLIDRVVNAVIHNARQTPRGEPLQDVGHRGGQFHFYRKGVVPDKSIIPPIDKEPEPSFSPDPPVQSHGKYLLSAVAIAALILFFVIRQCQRPATGEKKETKENITQPQEKPEKDIFDNPSLNQEEKPKESTIDNFAELLENGKSLYQEGLFREAAKKLEEALKLKPNNKEVRSFLQNCQEELDWQRAEKTGTEKGYRAFLKAYPKSRYAEKAQMSIAAQYRYQLYFTTNLNQDNVLTINIGKGKAPFDISITYLATGEQIRKTVSDAQSLEVSLSRFNSKAGKHMVEIVVRDFNFKAKGQKMPLLR